MDSSSKPLTDEQVSFFHENGYLVIPSQVSQAQCNMLRDRANTLASDFFEQAKARAVSSRPVFSTEQQSEQTNRVFLDSSTRVQCFLEAENHSGMAVNKIGHALADLDPAFSEFTFEQNLSAIVSQVGEPDAVVAQSMYIFKQPRVGGEYPPHRDSTFIYTDPPSCIALWWALEDADQNNGCLEVVPGSHIGNYLPCRFVLNDAKDGAVMRQIDEAGDDPAGSKEYIPLPCATGSLVLLHGAVLHRSAKNTSAQSRHAYTIHVVAPPSRASWSTENWLQRPLEQPFKPL